METLSRGYKTFSMLNSPEVDIYPLINVKMSTFVSKQEKSSFFYVDHVRLTFASSLCHLINAAKPANTWTVSQVYVDHVELTFASSLCHLINAAKPANTWTVSQVYVDHVELTFASSLCHLINAAKPANTWTVSQIC